MPCWLCALKSTGKRVSDMLPIHTLLWYKIISITRYGGCMHWVIASDHGGVHLKAAVKKYLETRGFSVDDMGVNDADTPACYPENADSVAISLLNGKADMGVLVCGTGIGVSMRANRYKGIRAALVSNAFTAQSAKAHNNANIVCFGERVTSPEEMQQYMDIFLKTEYEGGRHEQRLAALDAPLKSGE